MLLNWWSSEKNIAHLVVYWWKAVAHDVHPRIAQTWSHGSHVCGEMRLPTCSCQNDWCHLRIYNRCEFNHHSVITLNGVVFILGWKCVRSDWPWIIGLQLTLHPLQTFLITRNSCDMEFVWNVTSIDGFSIKFAGSRNTSFYDCEPSPLNWECNWIVFHSFNYYRNGTSQRIISSHQWKLGFNDIGWIFWCFNKNFACHFLQSI